MKIRLTDRIRAFEKKVERAIQDSCVFTKIFRTQKQLPNNTLKNNFLSFWGINDKPILFMKN